MSMRDGAPLFPRWLTALIGLGAFGYALFALRGVVTPVFFAFLLAYMLDPVVDRIAARGMRRDVAITVLLGALLGGITLFLLLAVPGIVRDVRAFLERLPGVMTATVERYGPLLASYGVPIPTSVGEFVAQLGAHGATLAEDARSPASS
jgi:predicted PurR-regulated permease PerM